MIAFTMAPWTDGIEKLLLPSISLCCKTPSLQNSQQSANVRKGSGYVLGCIGLNRTSLCLNSLCIHPQLYPRRFRDPNKHLHPAGHNDNKHSLD